MTHSPVWLHSLLVAATAGIAACNGSQAVPDAGLSPSCLEAKNHSDLDWLEDNIFTPSCAAFSPCHKGRAMSANELNLEKGNVRKNLLNVPHSEFTDQILVVAGEPANSYLMVLLGDREGPLNEAGTMPYNNPLLCKEKRDAIARWITSLGSEPDAGVNTDAGREDAGLQDAGPEDAGPEDAGREDAGPEDAGAPDAQGSQDATATDAVPPDGPKAEKAAH